MLLTLMAFSFLLVNTVYFLDFSPPNLMSLTVNFYPSGPPNLISISTSMFICYLSPFYLLLLAPHFIHIFPLVPHLSGMFWSSLFSLHLTLYLADALSYYSYFFKLLSFNFCFVCTMFATYSSLSSVTSIYVLFHTIYFALVFPFFT